MSEWTAYLRCVDQTPQSDEVIGEAAAVFEAVGLRDPASVVGIGAQEVAGKLPDESVASRALVRRAIRALEMAQMLRDATALAEASTAPVCAIQPSLLQGSADSSSGLIL